MKKLVLLMLVLGAVSSANANYTMNFEGGTGVTWNAVMLRYEVVAGTTFTMNVKVAEMTDPKATFRVNITSNNATLALGTVPANFTIAPTPGILEDGSVDNVRILNVAGGQLANMTIGTKLYDFTAQAGSLAGQVWNFGVWSGKYGNSGPVYSTRIDGMIATAPEFDVYVIPVVPVPGAILIGGIGIGLVGWFEKKKLFTINYVNISTGCTPEPATICLLGLGLLGLLRKRRA